MNWITTNICKFLSDVMSGMLDLFGSAIGNIFEIITDEIANSSLVTSATNYTMLLSLVLLAMAAGKQILDVYVFETSGDPDAEPLQLVVRVAQAVAVICCQSWIFNELMTFSKYFASDLLSSAHESDVSGHMLGLLQSIDTFNTQKVGFLFTLLLILIGFIIFMAIAGIRGAELVLMKVLFPIFAIDLITTNRERWKNFFTSYVVTFCTYGIQLLCFKACGMTFAMVDYGALSCTRILIVIGWIVVMIRAPRWLEKFLYSSGIGTTTTSFVRMAPLMLVRMA